MKSKAAVKRIIETLKGIYPDALCSLQYEKDYELLFAVRLSAQCTDERVNKVTPALFARFPTLESFAEADPAEVGEYIRSCGFFNGKARDLVACAQQILERHGGKVPGTMEELTVEEIAAANYQTLSDMNCIYVETAADAYGYVLRYWVSVDTGLLVAAEKQLDGETVYRMWETSSELDPIIETEFTLPDGTDLLAG